MRPRDPRVALADVLRAGQAIEEFVDGRTFDDYCRDLQLSSAVERQFEIVGEALGRAVREDPTLEARMVDAPDVIGFGSVTVMPASWHSRISGVLK